MYSDYCLLKDNTANYRNTTFQENFHKYHTHILDIPHPYLLRVGLRYSRPWPPTTLRARPGVLAPAVVDT